MFSKKQTLPERPSIPTVDEILEDLKNLDEDDVFYKFGAHNPVSGSDINTESSPFDIIRMVTKEDLDSPDKAYEKVKAFVDVYKSLDEQLVQMEYERENLKTLSESLRSQVHVVKEALEEQEQEKKFKF